MKEQHNHQKRSEEESVELNSRSFCKINQTGRLILNFKFLSSFNKLLGLSIIIVSSLASLK